MTKFEVLLGNVGTVVKTDHEDEARTVFAAYVRMSKAKTGRAAGQYVTLWTNAEDADPIVAEYPHGRMLGTVWV